MIDRKTLARLLGGHIDRFGAVRAPFPGSSVSDRSFVVRLVHDAPDGFVIFGLRGEERELAREHVRSRLSQAARCRDRKE